MVFLVIKKTNNSQSVAADVNEILFGYYLTNSWDDFHDLQKVKNEYEERKMRISVQEHSNQNARANEMAKVALAWTKENGYSTIVEKWWPKQDSAMISKAVGYKVDLDYNPLDILIKTKTNQFLGFSAKSGKTKGIIPFKNKGLGTVEKELGFELSGVFHDQEQKMLDKFPQIPKIRAKRKIWFKNNKKFYEANISNSVFVQNVFQGIRDKIFEKLDKYSNEQLWKYIKEKWMNSNEIKPRYVIVTGRGMDRVYSASVEDPLSRKNTKLEMKKEGHDKIRILSDNEKVLDMRVKFESTQMATSIKFSGE